MCNVWYASGQGAMQGMMLRVDMIQKKRLLMMILLEAQLKNRIKVDHLRRRVQVEEEGDTNTDKRDLRI
jgi:hypothetical protein